MKAVAFELLTSWIPEDLHLLLNPHSTDAFGIMENTFVCEAWILWFFLLILSLLGLFVVLTLCRLMTFSWNSLFGYFLEILAAFYDSMVWSGY